MQRVSVPVGASTLTIECGKLAKQANGSAYVSLGDTVVLATACSSHPREGIDFLQLTVDYREYTYAAGRIPGDPEHWGLREIPRCRERASPGKI